MGKIIVITNLTLDGVMQAPGHSDEDPRGGFTHGGWAAPYAAMQQPEAGTAFTNLCALLFGRITYERFADFWPKQTDNPFTNFLNHIPKYVVSTTLAEPLPWQNSTLIQNDPAQTLGKLKAEHAQNFVVFGSGVLVQSLLWWKLDELTLLIHPLVLGTGRHLFVEDGMPDTFKLH
jgi:dihydrofolate reductase